MPQEIILPAMLGIVAIMLFAIFYAIYSTKKFQKISLLWRRFFGAMSNRMIEKEYPSGKNVVTITWNEPFTVMIGQKTPTEFDPIALYSSQLVGEKYVVSYKISFWRKNMICHFFSKDIKGNIPKIIITAT